MVPWLYRITRWGVRQFFYLCCRARDCDVDRLPPSGAVLLAANHASFFDPMLVAAVMPRPVGFMARASLFRFPLFGRYIAALNAFPVDRKDPMAALRACGRRLENGEAVLIFPEGTRTRDGRLGEIKAGAALLAAQHDAPVVPVYMWGTFQSWPRWRLLPRPHRMRTYVGEPIRSEPGGERLGRKQIAERLAAALRALEERAFAENGLPPPPPQAASLAPIR